MHGDFGRSEPSVASILDCKADITQLDVTWLYDDFGDLTWSGNMAIAPSQAAQGNSGPKVQSVAGAKKEESYLELPVSASLLLSGHGAVPVRLPKSVEEKIAILREAQESGNNIRWGDLQKHIGDPQQKVSFVRKEPK